jgi:hypothetical protein
MIVGQRREVLSVAVVCAPTEATEFTGHFRAESAYGLTGDEARAALWELVCLHARVRRDEIDAAMGGAA